MHVSFSSGGAPDNVKKEVERQAADAAANQPAEIAKAITGFSDIIGKQLDGADPTKPASVVANIDVQYSKAASPAPVAKA